MRSFSAAFLDRDGTLMEELGYPSHPADVRLLRGAAEAVSKLNRAGVPVVVVTNQSGIGRGILTADQAATVQETLAARLADGRATLDGVYMCPHVPGDGCDCRKPAGGLYQRAARDLGLDLAAALYVGDRVRDIGIALRWGGTAALVRTGVPLPETIPDGVWVAEDLAEVVERALGECG